MFNILVCVSFFALVGAFAVGYKAANMLRERRKSRAFDYFRQAGAYPPIYTGYPDTQTKPTPTPHQNANAANTIDQLLYFGIILSILYAFWCGLT